MLLWRASLLLSVVILASPARHAQAAGSTPIMMAPSPAAPSTMPVAPAAPNYPATQTAPTYVQPANPDSTLNPGDQVTIEIVEDRDAPIVKRVTDTGELDFPYIGRLRVVGKNCGQVISEAKRQLEAKYYYHATIRLGIDQRNQVATMGRIYLSGNVTTPGTQVLADGERVTVSEAIIRAGGFSRFAEGRKVRISRKRKGGGSDNIEVDCDKIMKKGQTEGDVVLQDGDHIFVPQRTINW